MGPKLFSTVNSKHGNKYVTVFSLVLLHDIFQNDRICVETVFINRAGPSGFYRLN